MCQNHETPVMVYTYSFNNYIYLTKTSFFPQDIGAGKGKYYAVNIPLRDGMDDESYESIFVPIIAKVRLCLINQAL